MERKIKKVERTEYDEVVELTFSEGDIISALREKFDIPENASIELTGETYDANPYMSSPSGAGKLMARGTGAKATYNPNT